MRRFHMGKVVPLAAFPFLTLALASALTPNRKLLSLVPPTTRMVAGMVSPPRSGQPSSLLLITHSNLVDLNDFIALSGADSSRLIEQVIMVASDNGGGVFAEHGLLASGAFNQGVISRSAYKSAGANATVYRGIPILVVPPLARESESFHDVRWLAMMDSHLALFGTIPIVREELDRYLARSQADPSLERKLASLRRDDDTWCVATLPDNEEIQSIFKLIDSRLAELLRAGDTVQFGIHYGRWVEFEYEVTMHAKAGAEVVSQTLMQRSAAPQLNEASVLPAPDLSWSGGSVRGVLKISRARYEDWTAGVQAAHADALAAVHSTDR